MRASRTSKWYIDELLEFDWWNTGKWHIFKLVEMNRLFNTFKGFQHIRKCQNIPWQGLLSLTNKISCPHWYCILYIVCYMPYSDINQWLVMTLWSYDLINMHKIEWCLLIKIPWKMKWSSWNTKIIYDLKKIYIQYIIVEYLVFTRCSLVDIQEILNLPTYSCQCWVELTSHLLRLTRCACVVCDADR